MSEKKEEKRNQFAAAVKLLQGHPLGLDKWQTGIKNKILEAINKREAKQIEMERARGELEL